MMNDFDRKLKAAACSAMDYEYAKYPDPNDLDYEYQFSDNFNREMERICRKANYVYVSVGRHRLRRAAVVALIAAMIFAMTAGAIAVQKLYVRWNETENAEDGTIDVTFEVEDPNQTAGEFTFIQPKTPEGYIIESEMKYSDTEYEIQYSGSDGTVIYYMQSGGVDSTEVGIDYEEADYQKIAVNGHEGYSYEKAGNSALIWSDGISLFQLIGTCELNVLEEMAKK